MIEKKVVLEVAALARLDLTEGEVTQLANDLGKITAHIDRLATAPSLDLDHALDHAQATIPLSSLRPDRILESQRQETFLRNTPSSEAGYLKLPKVVE